MDDKAMIEAAVVAQGYSVKTWTESADGESALIGEFVVLNDDYEDEGLYEGDEGKLTACIVGSDAYHNKRVCFSFTPDAWSEDSGGTEVRDLDVLEPADA